MSISLTSRLSITGELTTSRDGGNATFEVHEGSTKTVANGTGADQANGVYVDDFSIAASGTLSIDLSGALTDAHGNALVFTAIKEIAIVADPTNTNDIIIGNGTNPFLGPFGAGAHTVTVGPGGRFNVCNYSAAGWAVTAATADILKLANSSSGTAVTGTIVIVGEI